ncbi:hypothetical protein SERLADRAFT_366120 [Serpula lacrymans var. lacrymans S7.9]|uniref:Uncharacterized protein n=1 Tax=Serpula lacrymans var. lacrymans (strain S7.9) TaxID=578457 RepID=F8NKE8_SERL9|nr:uncharacterized protein SERLADRAFT_366120 [Serpula lacrymans var. lacrymans S7.9]EGO28414.1 hypothetical protein SERLADRAFT_366120 [Serpula lacrymans var. lacrymans S7.9]
MPYKYSATQAHEDPKKPSPLLLLITHRQKSIQRSQSKHTQTQETSSSSSHTVRSSRKHQ